MNKNEVAGYAKQARRQEKDVVIEKFCTGKTVLDVGCIGQDRNFMADNWLHNKIKRIASRADGVDILLSEIDELKKKGYSMYSIDELKALNTKYDVVLMADVIEHVDDPVSFLKFYSAFLKDDGVMVISTPNSNRSNNFVNILFNNTYSVNPEHVFWFCPKTMAEVVDRAKLSLSDFYWAPHYYTAKKVKGLYQKFKYMLGHLLMMWRSNFNPNMIFIVKKEK